METITLKKEYKFEDQPPVSSIELNLDDLTGNDIIGATDILSSMGHVSVAPTLDPKLQALLAAQACGQPVEYIRGLPASDFTKVTQAVQNFLLA